MDMFVRIGDRIEFTAVAPAGRRWPGPQRSHVIVQLIATAGLVVSLAVAATSVSIGIARAHGPSVSNSVIAPR